MRAGAPRAPLRRTRVTAWLGLFALALALCAPLVSQLRASAAARERAFMAICSATDNVSATHPGVYSPPATHLDRCGYCGLLAGHPPLHYTAPMPRPLVVRHALPDPPPTPGRRVAARYTFASPRGPPAHA